jgi:transcriptional regulator with XRE-family HTH domain
MALETAIPSPHDDLTPGLAANLKALRKARGWSQTEVAERLGFHLTHVNRIETGRQVPSLEFVVKAAQTFGVGVDQLLAGEENPLEEVRLEDKALAERLRLIETLDPREKSALMTVIDSMLTKHRIRQFIEEQPAEAEAAR